jgi:hypothetical protein
MFRCNNQNRQSDSRGDVISFEAVTHKRRQGPFGGVLVRKLHLYANTSVKNVHALRAYKDKNKILLKRHFVLFGVQVRVGWDGGRWAG